MPAAAPAAMRRYSVSRSRGATAGSSASSAGGGPGRDAQILGVQIARRDRGLQRLVNLVELPAQRARDHVCGFHETYVAYRSFGDGPAELAEVQPGADPALEGKPARRGVLDPGHGDASHPGAGRGEHQGEGVHGEAGVEAGPEDGDFPLLRLAVDLASGGDAGGDGEGQLLAGRQDLDPPGHEPQDLRLDLLENRGGADDRGICAQLLDEPLGVAVDLDPEPAGQAEGDAEVLARRGRGGVGGSRHLDGRRLEKKSGHGLPDRAEPHYGDLHRARHGATPPLPSPAVSARPP
jgi:hypothetical protein